MPPKAPTRKTPPALASRGLTKAYGDLVALEPLDLTVADGERVVLVGHNGSGKTTLLRMADGLLEPTAGSIHVGGWAAGTWPTTRCSTTTCRCSSTWSTPAACTGRRAGRTGR